MASELVKFFWLGCQRMAGLPNKPGEWPADNFRVREHWNFLSGLVVR